MNKHHYNRNKHKIPEKVKWISISIFFILSFFINMCFYETQLFIRIFIISCLMLCAIGTMIYTKKGKDILLYIVMSKKEMQKIIWPKYKETLYTTLIVISVTIFISFILWSIDSVIFRLIAFIISLRF
ncbi:preprotein translocase subunit SecE [Buchnera aphidicola]|uniref:Protein translocase subunit SecE n=1 Tax=Buchnera aphidicola subsp. Acyrthosiphon pisum (strain 5A) TaxID=563178 RepID=A0A7U3YA54_BUCA5|nr:preprotein translocase subunit SecE [Buchnera aphidicola]ADP66444.1 preprotein translocase subunit SecE [Buchnera aphidicola str. TLW03 (Acyrthosiphon pisum)]OQX99124.1 MAG: preprotein translocase subunit SecE [Erwiniaceae bacterium 4572_131]ACL29871.1 preprotein translocase SecE subunit [Buchnera aphidicola str. Tuc7 (Acyrthosiphon pisum)]ACL30424.1 preprotein translocase SecE subunit [Buchnera aphidicola str. 5A (Acyrthosiphon pisum)]ADP65870.1 preprotein translocase subunit SecE [Buchner